MDYATFAAFAIPLLTALTFLAYKHPVVYRVLSSGLLLMAGGAAFGELASLISLHHPTRRLWFIILCGCVGYVFILRFLRELIEMAEPRRPRQKHPDEHPTEKRTDD